MRHRQSELTEGERRAAQRLRHTAQTGIKELESKERERIKGGGRKSLVSSSFTCVRDTVPPIRYLSVHLYILHMVLEYATVTMATGVYRAKEYIVPKEQTVRADST